jgi:hypothetical protein
VTRRARAIACPLALLITPVLIASAGAASKIAIAALGDPAPGVGQGLFAGPSFVGEPSAAGNGWIAFRSQVIGSAVEGIFAMNRVTGASTPVARVGETVDEKIGSIKQFLGRPTVNAHGDVAFAAVINPPDDAPADPLFLTPGGIFLSSGGKISVIAAPGFATELGTLDLTTPINLLSALTGIDIAERTPALNDAGDVAFAASTFSTAGPGGAIFAKRAGQELVAVKKLGDPYESGTFQILGPPALNNSGTLAFHGLVDGATVLDGVFTLTGDTLSLLIRDGPPPDKLAAPFEIDPLFEFGDVVALNDAGDVACTGGPIFDNSDDASFADLEGSPGVIVIRGGTPLLVGFPGLAVETFGSGTTRISDLVLGPEAGSRLAPPSLTPDGKVIFFAQVNDGSSQVILRADPDARTVRSLVRLGGASADPIAGGTYQAASSAPAADAAGNFVFSARIDNSATSQALIWQPAAGDAQVLPIGNAAPDSSIGFYGGPAFFPPQLNDAGDVVFRSYVTGGPASLGIFRYRRGTLEAVVRVRDVALSDGSRFANLVGEPSVNRNGDVAFAATVEGRAGRGIFAVSNGTLRTVALPLDDLSDPDRPNAFLRTIAANPSISDTGAIVFRGVVAWNRFPEIVPDTHENAVILADPSGGVRVIAAQGQDSGTGVPFFRFRDPTIRGDSVLFRALLGEFAGEGAGLFRADLAGVSPIAVEGQDLGGMTLATLQGKGLFDQAGEVFFSAQVKFAGDTNGAIIRSGQAGFETLVQTGDTLPQGGRIRSVGRPSVSSDGRVALRLGFEDFTGGVPGLFVMGDRPAQPFLRIAEGGAAGINGRITSLNQNVSLNASNHLAFLAGVGGGASRSAIFLAAPTTGRVPQLAFRRRPASLSENTEPKPRDRIKLSMVLEPGTLPRPPSGTDHDESKWVRPKAVTVTVADTLSTLWTGTLSSKDTQLRGHTLVKKRNARGTAIGRLRVQFARDKIRVTARSRPFSLTNNARGLGRHFDDTGSAILVPPFTVRLDVGEDGGAVTVQCPAKGRRFSCRS